MNIWEFARSIAIKPFFVRALSQKSALRTIFAMSNFFNQYYTIITLTKEERFDAHVNLILL